ncbi:hypothetical protein [Cupriavidus sp. D384]|nr:hypothetical protein [Cupriavidus sp. D384]
MTDTQRYTRREKQKGRSFERPFAEILGWLMGLEPTTTGITI